MVEQLGQPEILRVLNQVEIGFAVIELDGRLRFANQGFLKTRGLDSELKNGIDEAFRNGTQDRFVGESITKDPEGSTRWISFDANLIRDPKTGQPESQFLIIQDITARVKAELAAVELRKKADRKIQEDIEQQKRVNDELRQAQERAERASRMKSHFLANMSHEIRTPLGAILGFTELLADPNTEEGERTEFLGVIARNGKSLSRIVDDVLDLSKVEAGLLSFERIPFCPRTLVSDIATLFSEKARKKGIDLQTVVAADIARSVVSDPSRIRQIVSNLVSNAVKFTSRGYVKLRVESSESEIRFVIEDSGIGIGPQHLNNLFQPFMQGEEALSRKYGGTGLGLYLSRKLAEALDGTLEISRTEQNAGTTLTLRLPIKLSSLKEANDWIHETVPSGMSNKALDGLRILVVDDTADNRLLISRMLSKSGALVEFATNGPEGVDRASNQPFDLILMDLQMPEMDGFEATERIRKKLIKTPIVALTAHAVDEIRERCEQTGFSGFLTKPVDSKSLMAAAIAVASERGLNASRTPM